MRYSKSFIYTLKEDQKEAAIVSHNLLLRGGFIVKLASGIYNYLPLGLRVLKKVSDIVRDEMNKAGAIEILMAAIQPAELWKESGRWNDYGKELLRIKDRGDRDFVFGPTHEEVVTDIVRRFAKSYKNLPVNLYQIQTKFRDELRPRFGLMRGREFIMKDAYSFDKDEAGMDISYEKMRKAYNNIFARCGLNFRSVEADTGSIGGKDSEEFMVLSKTGEDEIVICDSCNYASNVERADSIVNDESGQEQELKLIPTPNKQTIKDVCEFLNANPEFSAKALVYENEKGEVFCFFVEGDDELNMVKAMRATDSIELNMVDDEKLKELGLEKGYIGPVNFPNKSMKIICDRRITKRNTLVVGANKENYHYIGAKFGRDFDCEVADLRVVKEHEICPRCKKGHLKKVRGIEVGHIFKLGQKYSKAMNATFLDENGKSVPYFMGCYGIGIGRTAQAAIEQSHDEDGIIWPITIAPYEVEIVSLDTRNKELVEFCDSLHEELEKAGIEVLYDDRDERAGVKLNDMDLIGIPLRVIVGKKSFDGGNVELSLRRDKKRWVVKKQDTIAEIKKTLKKLYDEIEEARNG
ncbi:proline--tRNA ligase [Hippea jasoniae]|uniref:proline--tRNA ligase n=1 Tax=Hippea jasoniae TaxID=944479 RepID=UPI0005535AF4|nr:proline--tRNA ligase [Hippea jasoniae]